jgi:hypothetical protein
MGCFPQYSGSASHHCRQLDGHGESPDSRGAFGLVLGGWLGTTLWSITVYDLHSDLVINEVNKYNLNGDTTHLGPDGSYTIYLSKKSRGENWLPAREVGRIYLTLRMENRRQNRDAPPARQHVTELLAEGW